MFEKNPIEAQLDAEITTVLNSLNTQEDKTDESYTKLVANFETLYELRHKSRISAETWATIGANAVGLIVLMNHERTHVIASKAFGLVKKLF